VYVGVCARVSGTARRTFNPRKGAGPQPVALGQTDFARKGPISQSAPRLAASRHAAGRQKLGYWVDELGLDRADCAITTGKGTARLPEPRVYSRATPSSRWAQPQRWRYFWPRHTTNARPNGAKPLSGAEPPA